METLQNIYALIPNNNAYIDFRPCGYTLVNYYYFCFIVSNYYEKTVKEKQEHIYISMKKKIC